MHDSVETILLYSSVVTRIHASAFLSKICHITHMHAHSQTWITKRGKAKGSRGCGTPSTSKISSKRIDEEDDTWAQINVRPAAFKRLKHGQDFIKRDMQTH